MQEKVRKLVDKYNIKTDIKTRYIDLVSEVGELGKELLKGDNYNTSPYKQTNDTIVEIGDVLFSLLELCNTLGVNYKDALNESLIKYENRFHIKNNISSDK